MIKHLFRSALNYVPTVLFILVLAIAALLRLYRIAEWMPWETDAGRDLYVGKYMFNPHLAAWELRPDPSPLN